MISYRDMTFCTFDKCIKHYPSMCRRVLTDHDLKVLREGDYLVSVFAEKPECFEEEIGRCKE